MPKHTKDSLYHRVLRVAAAVCALVLLFESGLIHESSTALAQNTHRYLANAVGMSVGVPKNELNSLTAELTSQKLALEQREAAIREREIEVGLAPGESPNERAIYLLSGILFVLLVLIILNYVLDYLRTREVSLPRVNKTV